MKRLAPRSSASKYRAVKQPPCPQCGYRHDSAREARRCGLLELCLRAGAIRALRRQVRYPLEVNGQRITTYIADFVYEEDGHEVVEDSKGYRTDVYQLKRRLMLVLLGITIRET